MVHHNLSHIYNSSIFIFIQKFQQIFRQLFRFFSPHNFIIFTKIILKFLLGTFRVKIHRNFLIIYLRIKPHKICSAHVISKAGPKVCAVPVAAVSTYNVDRLCVISSGVSLTSFGTQGSAPRRASRPESAQSAPPQ